MKKVLLVFVVLFLFPQFLYCQNSKGLPPYSVFDRFKKLSPSQYDMKIKEKKKKMALRITINNKIFRVILSDEDISNVDSIKISIHSDLKERDVSIRKCFTNTRFRQTLCVKCFNCGKKLVSNEMLLYSHIPPTESDILKDSRAHKRLCPPNLRRQPNQ